jgi:hypothetical protein
VDQRSDAGRRRRELNAPARLGQLRHSRWPAATPHIVKDFTGIEGSVERVFVTDVGEGPTHPRPRLTIATILSDP